MTTLGHYIEVGKVPAPKPTLIGRYEVRAWSEEEIERVRALLPKIANGRKTRYQKLREKGKATGKSAGATQAKPHKQGSRKQKRFKKK